MGIPYGNEVELRKYAKQVRSLILEQNDIDKALVLIKEHEDILTFNYGRNNYQSLLPTIRFQPVLKDKYKYLDEIIHAGFQIYENSQDYDQLVFFAAARCNVKSLQLCMSKISIENRNKTKEGDTILLFFVKYADLENANYLNTLQVLVNEYKLDVNIADYYDHSPIIILLNKYVCLLEQHITHYSSIILKAVNIILTSNNVDLLSHKINERNAQNIIDSFNLQEHLETLKLHNCSAADRFKIEEADDSVLFSLLVQTKEDEFLRCIKETNHKEKMNIDDGSNTLLQLACTKNLTKVVRYFIDEGANLTKTTRRNHKTPLEIAARRNHYNIFSDLLKSNQIIVDSKLFSTFVLNRGRQIKIKYFDEILSYEGLQVDIAHSNGNTPLHYSIIFSNIEAILKLLKRGASLLVKNKNGKDPLDYISKEELELYLDQCVLLDQRNKLYDTKYELRFDFNGLTGRKNKIDHVDSELEVVSRIYSSEKLRPLIGHPLISTFVEMKWNLISSFYTKLFLVYVFLFVNSFILTLTSCANHATYVCLMIMTFITLSTKIQALTKSRDVKQIVAPLYHITLILLSGYFYNNKGIFSFLLMLILFYQFLKQHLFFFKYNALMIHILIKDSLYILSLFGLYYFHDFEDFTYFKLILIVPSLIILYAILFTANILADHIGDNKYVSNEANALNFIKFSENVYQVSKNILGNPFIPEHFVENIKENKLHVHFVLNKNKFSNEKFVLLKLDSSTVKKLQDFVAKSRKKV